MHLVPVRPLAAFDILSDFEGTSASAGSSAAAVGGQEDGAYSISGRNVHSDSTVALMFQVFCLNVSGIFIMLQVFPNLFPVDANQVGEKCKSSLRTI